jgi:hypothetical protein
VTDDEGVPVWASIAAYHPGNYRVVYFCMAEADGTYSLAGLPAGTYYVSFEAQGFTPEWFDGMTTRAKATRLHLTEGDVVTGLDATLAPLTAGGI